MTRAMVAVEMLTVNNNGIMEFRETPPLASTVDMVEGCKWTDKQVELQMWTRLAALALESKDHKIVTFCSLKALEFADSGTGHRGRQQEG